MVTFFELLIAKIETIEDLTFWLCMYDEYFSTNTVHNLEKKVIFTPTFSVMCGYRSKYMPNKQGSKLTNYSSLAWPFELVAHFQRSDMKQTPACDWCILILVRLACWKTLKDDVKRWMSKDTRSACNTERGCYIEPNIKDWYVNFSPITRSNF